MNLFREVSTKLCRAKIGHVVTSCHGRDRFCIRLTAPVTSNIQANTRCLSFYLHSISSNKESKIVVDCNKRLFSGNSCLHAPRGSPRGTTTRGAGSEISTRPPSPQPTSGTTEHNNPALRNAKSDPETIKKLIESSNSVQDSDIPPEFPSDFVKNQARRDQTRGSYRPKIDPKDTSVFLFPGQGSQFVGMGRDVISIPKVQEMYKVASDILDYDLLELCLNGPKEKLDKTVHCQPAVFVASLAAVEKLKEENPMAIEQCIATAGFSVGEYAALVFAGSLSFESALGIVRERAQAMQEASEDVPSGMMTTFLGPDNKIKLACHTAKLYCVKELGMDPQLVDCIVANYLYPECKVVAGNAEALDFINKNSKQFGIRRTKALAVSGAFHSKLMYPAMSVLKEVLSDVAVKRPLINVHSNVDTYPYRNAKKLRYLLCRQVCEPVKWEQILHKIYQRPKDADFPNTYELGPGRQLGAILKMTNNQAYQNYRSVAV